MWCYLAAEMPVNQAFGRILAEGPRPDDWRTSAQHTAANLSIERYDVEVIPVLSDDRSGSRVNSVFEIWPSCLKEQGEELVAA